MTGGLSGRAVSLFFVQLRLGGELNIFEKKKGMNKTLLTSEKYIKGITPIDENMAGSYLLDAVLVAQEEDLQTVIGTAMLRKLQSLVEDGTIAETDNAAYKELLDDYIQPYLAYDSVVRLLPCTENKIVNMGVMRAYDEKLTNVQDTEKVADWFVSRADFRRLVLIKWLQTNRKLFPELKDNCGCFSADFGSVLYSAASSSIFLGGARNPDRKWRR